MRPEDRWMRYAACRGKTETMYPPGGDDSLTRKRRRDPYAKARALCASCEVFTACESYIAAHPQRFGMWAGRTPDERPIPPLETEVALPARGRAMSDAEVATARRRYAQGDSPTGMALDYGVHVSVLLRAVRGDTYRHVTADPVAPRRAPQRAPLTPDEIAAAATRYEHGESIASMASDFDVTSQALGRAIRRTRAHSVVGSD